MNFDVSKYVNVFIILLGLIVFEAMNWGETTLMDYFC